MCMVCRRCFDTGLGHAVKGVALAATVAVWLSLGWGGWQQTGLLVFYLLVVSAEISAIALVTALLTALFADIGAFSVLPFGVEPSGIVLIALVLASARKGSRLLDLRGEKLAGITLTPARTRFLGSVFSLLAAASFAAMSLRYVLLVNAFALGVLYGLSRWWLRRLAPASHNLERKRPVLGTVLPFLFALALSGLLLEGGARLLIPELAQLSDAIDSDRDYIFLTRPGGAGVHTFPVSSTQTKTVLLRISGQGIRDRAVPPKEPDEFRIAMIGDSHTMGYSVEEKDSIPRLLEDKLRAAMPGAKICVLNCGLAGAGVLQELGMLRERVFALQPDLVILQLFPGNDMDNALEVVNKRLRAYLEPWHETLRDYRFNNLIRVRMERWAQRNIRAYQALWQATETRWIFNAVGKLRFAASIGDGGDASEDRPQSLEVDLVEWYPELDEAMAIMKAYILKMRAECSGRGIDFMAYCTPTHDDVLEERWKTTAASANPPVPYEHLKALNRFNAFFAEQSIPHVSVFEALRDAGRPMATYYVLDGHLKELGNSVVADVWAKFLTGGYLKERLPAGAKK